MDNKSSGIHHICLFQLKSIPIFPVPDRSKNINFDNPGFVAGKTKKESGMHLMLPLQYESAREEIEKVLPILNV